jgi:thiamine biosynthesis lipoprotein
MLVELARPVRRHVSVMGTVASIHVHGAEHDRAVGAIEATLADLARFEAMFSTFRADSEISRISAGTLDLLGASPEVIDVLDACTFLEHVSDGAFSARRPEQPAVLDPAGFVKGWAAERAARHLDQAMLSSWYLSVGGDLFARGRNGAGLLWRIGIADPHGAGDVAALLDVENLAVATSGTSQRGSHLWDGRSGARVAPLASMTVVGPSLTWADAFATAAFAMGVDGLAWVEQFAGYGALAVHHDGELSATPVARALLVV